MNQKTQNITMVKKLAIDKIILLIKIILGKKDPNVIIKKV